MAKERDYAKEYAKEREKRLAREKMVGAKLSRQLADEFEAKCTRNGKTKNAVLKSYIERYTYEGFDQ